MLKTPFTPNKRVFDLKFLLCSNSGGGKTDFCTRYTRGPVHFYMLDKGGEKTIEKLLISRPASVPPVSVDILSGKDVTYSRVWKHLAEDEKSGFFDEMAKSNGLVVFDSITTANQMATQEIMKLSSIMPSGPGRALDNKKGMSPAHWGQLLNWMTALINALQSVPCATATTVHLHTLMDGESTVVARYPSVNGQFRQLIGKDFDEVYLLDRKKSAQTIYMEERMKFTAKTRSFTSGSYKDITLDQLAKAYMSNDTLEKLTK